MLFVALLSGVTDVAGASLSSGARASTACSFTASDTSGVSEPLALSASIGHTGCISLLASGPPGSSVTITEVTPGVAGGTPVAVLDPQDGKATLGGGVEWRCDRLTRTFQATETLADGSQQSATAAVTTPSCADRLAATVTGPRLHRGYPLTIALIDRWGLGGLRVRACLSAGDPRSCPSVTLKPGPSATDLRLTPTTAGAPTVVISDAYQSIRRRLRVLAGRPLLLATGDSEMQILDDDLASDLSGSGGARVVGDAHQSTAISSPFFFNWPAHAVAQVDADHPDIVAMFLGGNEGFRLGRANCCGLDWSREYAVRVAGMMRLYLQHGAAAVYWFLIPTPSKEPFVRVVRAVNRGIVLAAAQFHEGVHVFDLRPVFSPGGRYIDSLRHDGRTITVHEPDGFHLSAASDLIVAQMFIERLRRDGLLPYPKARAAAASAVR